MANTNPSKIFAPLGSSNHVPYDREANDYYATDPSAIDHLFSVQEFHGTIWEPSCGEGHLSKRMESFGKRVISSDLIDRGFGSVGVDFLKSKLPILEYDIITNPPYKLGVQFVRRSLDLLQPNRKCAMFLKLTFCESAQRRALFDSDPPEFIYVFSKRMKCAMNGKFEGTNSSAACYAWFIWRKGFNGDTILRWI